MTRSTVGTALAAACASAGLAVGLAFGNGPAPADATDRSPAGAGVEYGRPVPPAVECRVTRAWEDYSARVRVTFPDGRVRTFSGGGS